MTAPTKLTLYQGAMRFLGQRRLASLTEAVEGRYLLDGVWDEGAVDACLGLGQWTFATRSVQINNDPSITPPFGYIYAFSKPTDWIKTIGMAADEFFAARLRDEQAKDESGFWYAMITPIYVRYVSNDSSYGNNFALWPPNFTNFVQAYLGWKISPNLLKNPNDRTDVERRYQRMLLTAKSSDAMNTNSPQLPEGQWAKARHGRRIGRWDRGSRGELIG